MPTTALPNQSRLWEKRRVALGMGAAVLWALLAPLPVHVTDEEAEAQRLASLLLSGRARAGARAGTRCPVIRWAWGWQSGSRLGPRGLVTWHSCQVVRGARLQPTSPGLHRESPGPRSPSRAPVGKPGSL